MIYAAMNKVLSGIKSLYLDANILIYLVEASNEENQPVLAAFQEADELGIAFYTSEITLTECLNGAFRGANSELVDQYDSLLSEGAFISIVPVNRPALIEASRLGAALRLKTIDALHYASAVISGCDALLTNDKAFKSSDGLKVVQLSKFKT